MLWLPLTASPGAFLSLKTSEDSRDPEVDTVIFSILDRSKEERNEIKGRNGNGAKPRKICRAAPCSAILEQRQRCRTLVDTRT